MSRYIDLHAHSTYSMLDGYGKIEQIVERYIELGRNAGTITDHGNIFGHVPFEQKMRKAGLKPIFGCLPAASPIYTQNGVVAIENIKPGDMALTHRGQYRKVVAISQRNYSGNMCNVYLSGSSGACPFKLTEEHPLLIADNCGNTQFIAAGKVAPGRIRDYEAGIDNWTAYACFPKTKAPSYMNNITTSQARLLGLYVAEGCPLGSGFVLTFNLNELFTHANSVYGILRAMTNKTVSLYVRLEKHTCEVYCGDKAIAAWLITNCGKGSKNKIVPSAIFNSDLEIKKEFVNAYFDGDAKSGLGTDTQRTVRTSSKMLAYGVKRLLADMGEWVNVIYESRDKKDCWVIPYKPIRSYSHFKYDDNYVYKPIKKIEMEIVNCTVYNLEVEQDNSYVSDMVVHNCEFYIVQDMKEKTSRYIPSLGASANPHVTVFAMNQTGYGNLLKLSTLSYEEGYYYKPRIDWTTLQKYQDGLCVLSGCVGGWPSSLIINKSDNDAYSFVTEQRQRIEHFYVEIIPEPGLAESHKTTPILMGIARDLNIPLVMTSDAHFPRPEDHRAQDTMLCIGLGTTMSDTKRYIKLPAYQYYCTERELMDRALQTLSGKVTREISDALIQAMNNTGLIADMCEVEIPKAKPLLFPGVTYPQTADNVLWIAVQEGLQARLQQGRIDPAQIVIYQERAAMEFTVIRDKKFCDYILTVTDICLWAKQQNSIVVCRGSAGGCLLLFLLGCSETDSVMHDLDFSRFLDYTRSDPPDIDIDFQTDMRERVIQYISNTYGKDNVCQILALGTIRAKQAVQDVAAVHGISREKYAPLAAAMDSKDDDVEAQISSLRDPAALAVLKKYPIFNMIDGLVGQCRQSSIHAAGVLISSEPLTNYIAVCRQPNKPVVASVDKYGAAYLNFLKLDALTVSALDVISDTLKAIGANTEWLYRLPFDDVAAYELAMSGKVAGVFQLDGSAARIGAQTRLDSLKELFAASALCRPGAIEHVPTYVRNKFNPQALQQYLRSIHPIAAEIVESTYGVLAYQEQVMRICRRLALMSDLDVTKFRKRISAATTFMTELGEEFKTPFYDGCKRNGVQHGEIDYWWNAIRAHGLYSFNLAHCATYGIVGYWMLYLKAHYPEAYFASFLNREGAASQPNPLLMKRLIREFRQTGGKIILLDPAQSATSFRSIGYNTIVGGWSNITGIGQSQANSIIANGPYKSWLDARDRIPPTVFYKLYECGITGDLPYSQAGVIELAPWMPVCTIGDTEHKLKAQCNGDSPAILPQGDQIRGKPVMCGYVTAKYKKVRGGHFKGETIIYVLEDTEGAIEFRVSSKQAALASRVKAALKIGDYVALQGWWSGEALFITDYKLLYRRT